MARVLSLGLFLALASLAPRAVHSLGWGWDSRQRGGVGRRHFIPEDRYPQARCLDGTPPAVYIRRTLSKKWFVFLEGWGFCFSLQDCLERSRGVHGSSHGEPRWRDLRRDGPYFSADGEENPLLHDFNWVFVRYCDGGYFSGDVAEPLRVGASQVFFRGRFIREAVVHFLRREHAMDSATDVVLAGCSSGGISALFAADAWRRLMPSAARFAVFADSGYFLGTSSYIQPKRFIVAYQNASMSLASGCVDRYRDEPWACFSAPNALPYATVPVFVWQSRYDTNQLLGVCDSLSRAARVRCVNAFGARIQASVEAVLAAGDGFFVDGCSRHCWDDRGPVLRAEGISPLRALSDWYRGSTVRIVQRGLYPCRACCLAEEVLFA